jgi:hypothetical protein
MAVSDILDIWNKAVLDIGAKTSIASLTEQSAEAAACALRYESVVKSVLRQADWNSARFTAALTDITATLPPPNRWAYSYSYPADCQRIWRMETPTGVLWAWPQQLQGFEVAQGMNGSSIPTRSIYSNMTELSAIYTQYAYDSAHGYYEALWEPDLKEAIGWALAAVIAGPLTGNGQIIQTTRSEALRWLELAKASCANESAPNSMDMPVAESLAIRGYSEVWPYCYPNVNWP